ncbi:alpha/beta fold hydrolase [Paraburkholderia sp. GAS334]|uniref:alpha/beta fold hydrolase n=1 Tax=Paraburkholderia sp. GAS334 TaxID=3035131 RepID=UPI003D22B0FD
MFTDNPSDSIVQLRHSATPWRDIGTGQLGTVLALHSLGLDRRAFDLLRQQLAPGWRIVSYDLLAHGSATLSMSAALAFEDWVDDALAALARFDGQRVHVLGHSLGGSIAAAAVSRRPELVASLTLVTTPPHGFAEFKNRAHAALAGGIEGVLDDTLQRWFGGTNSSKAVLDYARECLMAMSPEEWAAAWTAFAQFDGYRELAQFLPPTLAVAGSIDLSTPPAAMRQIVQAFVEAKAGQNIQFAEISNAGHMVALTTPGQLASLLTRHWESSGSHEPAPNAEGSR